MSQHVFLVLAQLETELVGHSGAHEFRELHEKGILSLHLRSQEPNK
jgi:hypothetical protein